MNAVAALEKSILAVAEAWTSYHRECTAERDHEPRLTNRDDLVEFVLYLEAPDMRELDCVRDCLDADDHAVELEAEIERRKEATELWLDSVDANCGPGGYEGLWTEASSRIWG